MKYEGEIDLEGRKLGLEEALSRLIAQYMDKWGSFYLMADKNQKQFSAPSIRYKYGRIEDQGTLKAMLKKYSKKTVQHVYYSDWNRNMNFYIYFA